LHLAFAGIAGEARVFAAATEYGANRLLARHDGSGPLIMEAKGAAVPGRECVVTVEVTQWQGLGGIIGPVHLVAPRDERPAPPVEGRRVLLDLPFDHIDGEMTPDDSGFDHMAKVTGAQLVDGRFGKALKFDGEDDAVVVPDSAVFDLPGDELSWELWFTADAPVVHDIVYHNLITKTPNYTNGLLLNYQARDSKVGFIQGSATGAPNVSVGAYGRWHHVVATYADNVQRLYYDGRLTAERFNPIRPTLSSQPIRIGGGGADVPRASRVTIDAVRLYNYALSADEVAERFAR
jgi:hypothetical protein